MKMRSALLFIALIAAIHALGFIWYQRPDWDVAWTDQGGYQLLANGLVRSGQFTRYPDASPFVPEAIRTPGYPLFVALVYRAFGVSHLAVALVQAAMFVGLCLVVYLLAKEITTIPTSRAAALLTACYPPIPYYGALILTEVWTTCILVLAMYLCVLAMRTQRTWVFAESGLCLGLTALSRPVFILLPLFLMAAALTPLTALEGGAARPRRNAMAGWAVLLCVSLLTVTPWFLYNHRHFGRFTLSAAGGIGRPVWEGSWQGMWSGRLQATLTDLADRPPSDQELADRVRALARETHLDPTPMLLYVTQWREIRRIWTRPAAPRERVDARIEGDQEYLRVGVTNIKVAPVKYLARRVTRGLFVLWVGELPIRYTQINHVSRSVIVVIWLVQLMLIGLALVGFLCTWRDGRQMVAAVLAAPLVYVTIVHFFLLTEARQSLPVKPLLLIFAAIGLVRLVGRVGSARQAS
jgi:hypothetical protein